MIRRSTANATVDEERIARLAIIRTAQDAAGIPRSRENGLQIVHCPDLTAHEVTIPAALFIVLCNVKAKAEEITTAAVQLGSSQRDAPEDAVAFNAALASLQKLLADQVDRLAAIQEAISLG